jgi:hypothetical protein
MARLRREVDFWLGLLDLFGYASVVPVYYQDPGCSVLPEEDDDLPGTGLRLRGVRAANNNGLTFYYVCTEYTIRFTVLRS